MKRSTWIILHGLIVGIFVGAGIITTFIGFALYHLSGYATALSIMLWGIVYLILAAVAWIEVNKKVTEALKKLKK